MVVYGPHAFHLRMDGYVNSWKTWQLDLADQIPSPLMDYERELNATEKTQLRLIYAIKANAAHEPRAAKLKETDRMDLRTSDDKTYERWVQRAIISFRSHGKGTPVSHQRLQKQKHGKISQHRSETTTAHSSTVEKATSVLPSKPSQSLNGSAPDTPAMKTPTLAPTSTAQTVPDSARTVLDTTQTVPDTLPTLVNQPASDLVSSAKESLLGKSVWTECVKRTGHRRAASLSPKTCICQGSSSRRCGSEPPNGSQSSPMPSPSDSSGRFTDCAQHSSEPSPAFSGSRPSIGKDANRQLPCFSVPSLQETSAAAPGPQCVNPRDLMLNPFKTNEQGDYMNIDLTVSKSIFPPHPSFRDGRSDERNEVASHSSTSRQPSSSRHSSPTQASGPSDHDSDDSMDEISEQPPQDIVSSELQQGRVPSEDLTKEISRQRALSNKRVHEANEEEEVDSLSSSPSKKRPRQEPKDVISDRYLRDRTKAADPGSSNSKESIHNSNEKLASTSVNSPLQGKGHPAIASQHKSVAKKRTQNHASKMRYRVLNAKQQIASQRSKLILISDDDEEGLPDAQYTDTETPSKELILLDKPVDPVYGNKEAMEEGVRLPQIGVRNIALTYHTI